MSSYKIVKPKTKPRTTLEQKIMILDHYHQSQKSQAETVDFFKNQYSISTSSFSEWVRDEMNLRELYNGSNEFLKKSKRKLIFKYDKINEDMDKIVQDCLIKGQPINESFLREHWVKLAQLHGVQDPKRLLTFSHGWLTQFKKRNGIDRQSRLKSGNMDSESQPMAVSNNHNNNTTTTTNLPQLQVSDINELINNGNQQKFQLSNNSTFLHIENLNEDYLSLQNSLNNYENLVNSGELNELQQQAGQGQGHSQQDTRSLSTVSSNTSLSSTSSKHTTSSPTSSISSNGSKIEDTITDGDFEMFLNKYGRDFLMVNQSKFPKSFKLLNELQQVFFREREIYNDQKLRELLFKR